MKNQSHSNLIVRSSLALMLALSIWAPAQAQSSAPAEGKTMMGGKMMAPHEAMTESHHAMTEPQQTMMQRHQAMMADMKTQDAELAAQVAKMNSAPADKKLDLMAAIVTRLVEQRTAMSARMGMMQGEMMMSTMPGMPMGTNSPSQSPMMKGMGADDKTGEAKK